MGFLHSREPCIVHGDLKSENVLVEKKAFCVQPKLLDFGLARLLTRRPRPLGGTRPWMAPEAFRRDPSVRPKPSADVFSCGRLIYFVVTRVEPLKGMGKKAIGRCLNEGRFPALDWPKASALEDASKNTVEQCLKVPECLRPSTKELYEAIVAWPFDSSVTMLKGALDRKQGISSPQGLCFGDESFRVEQGAGADAQECVAMRPSSNVQRFAMTNSTVLTSKIGRIDSLLQTISTWNYVIPPQSCCKIHAGVLAVQECLLELNRLSCPSRASSEHTVFQCSGCGLCEQLFERGTGPLLCQSCNCELRDVKRPSPRMQPGILQL